MTFPSWGFYNPITFSGICAHRAMRTEARTVTVLKHFLAESLHDFGGVEP